VRTLTHEMFKEGNVFGPPTNYKAGFISLKMCQLVALDCCSGFEELVAIQVG